MIRTGIPVSTWEQEGDEVIMTAWRILTDPATDPAPTDDEIRAAWGV